MTPSDSETERRRMPTKKDSMYERRKPYARVNIHPLDGYECSLEDQTGGDDDDDDRDTWG